MITPEFMKEIEQCSLDDLQLIYDTQKELYSYEEMEIIRQRIDELEKEKQNAINAWIEQNLPKEISCPKCDGPNPFENSHCLFCGHALDKTMYYDPNFYAPKEEDEIDNETENGPSYTFQLVISFLIPLIGFILGAILLAKDDEDEKSVGKVCIILGIISMLLSFVLTVLVIG